MLGDGMDPSTRSVRRSMRAIQHGAGVYRDRQEDGAELKCGGKRATGDGLDDGYFVEPTVFDHAP